MGIPEQLIIRTIQFYMMKEVADMTQLLEKEHLNIIIPCNYNMNVHNNAHCTMLFLYQSEQCIMLLREQDERRNYELLGLSY